MDEEEREQAIVAWVEEALAALPGDIAGWIANVAILVEDEDPAHPFRLGLYEGVPRTRRGAAAPLLPDRITIYRRPLERLAGSDPGRLRERVHHVVRHELAHHFGISDARLREIGRY
jgi:predicted Zn-dependent protease with MMP-like domain